MEGEDPDLGGRKTRPRGGRTVRKLHVDQQTACRRYSATLIPRSERGPGIVDAYLESQWFRTSVYVWHHNFQRSGLQITQGMGGRSEIARGERYRHNSAKGKQHMVGRRG